jgi:hypothetical protein
MQQEKRVFNAVLDGRIKPNAVASSPKDALARQWGSMFRRVQASSCIPDNVRCDFGNTGQDERKKNEPDTGR